MNTVRQWVRENVDLVLITAIGLIVLLVLLSGCTAVVTKPDPNLTKMDYVFCKGGIGGDWRVATQVDKATGEEQMVLFLFSVGGPYDKDHVICAVSGDHAILDLGKGQQS